MSPYSITRENAARDLAALRATIDGRHYPDESEAAQIAVLQELADSIEEQVKPEEPEPFSVVQAVDPDGRDITAIRVFPGANLAWSSGSAWYRWADLKAIRVLRRGVGADPILDRLADSPRLEDARAEGYNDGVEAAKSAAISLLLIKRERAITGERKDAYEKAIADIESIEALS
jgi:hypothetical protein